MLAGIPQDYRLQINKLELHPRTHLNEPDVTSTSVAVIERLAGVIASLACAAQAVLTRSRLLAFSSLPCFIC